MLHGENQPITGKLPLLRLVTVPESVKSGEIHDTHVHGMTLMIALHGTSARLGNKGHRSLRQPKRGSTSMDVCALQGPKQQRLDNNMVKEEQRKSGGEAYAYA